MFQQDFSNWISENEFIDKFIQESQLNAKYTYQLLEWISYNRLKNIEYLDEGGFGIIYKAIWLDGRIKYWNDNERKYIRENDMIVSLKRFKKSSKSYWIIWIYSRSKNLRLHSSNEICRTWQFEKKFIKYS